MAVPELHPAWAATSPFIDKWMAAFVAALGTVEDVIRGEEAKVKSQRTGAEFTYTYAGLATYFAASRPKLAEHGLAISQSVTNDDGVVTVWTTILHTSGQWVTFLPLTFATSSNPQDVGSAMTYARRYSHMAALGLASEDDDGQRAKEGAQRRGQQHRGGSQQPSGQPDEPTYTKAQVDLRKLWYDELEATEAPFLADVRTAFILRWGSRIDGLDDATCEAATPWVATVGLAMGQGWDAVKAVIDRMAVPPAAEGTSIPTDDGSPAPDAPETGPGSPEPAAAAPDGGTPAGDEPAAEQTPTEAGQPAVPARGRRQS
jgi:hypothetical protein